MSEVSYRCPICEEPLVEVEAALHRAWWNELFFGWGSSQLQVRSGRGWWSFMTPTRRAEGLYCENCGSLTIAPSIRRHRDELGLDT